MRFSALKDRPGVTLSMYSSSEAAVTSTKSRSSMGAFSTGESFPDRSDITPMTNGSSTIFSLS